MILLRPLVFFDPETTGPDATNGCFLLELARGELSGYSYADGAGHMVHTENVNGCEIRLIEVTCE